MDQIYDECVRTPSTNTIQKAPIDLDSMSKKLLGETFWSMDCNYNTPTLKSYFDEFYKKYLKNKNNLAVDGPSCCGKSSMISSANPIKINDYSNINDNNSYNKIGEASLTYVIINDKMMETPNVVSDRSVISNLTYQMAYYVMNLDVNGLIYTRSMHSICEEFINIHNLKPLLQYLKAKKYNILIILDSSFEHSAIRMNKRGLKQKSSSDVVKSLCLEYHRAQTAAFSFMANFLNLPCLDINYLRTTYNKSDDEIFALNSSSFKEYFLKHLNIDNSKVNILTELTNMGNQTIQDLHTITIQITNR
ncbi:TK2 [Callinectes sapidus nudivirus]|nr:TK2 [Callinectes sapidus nudivirus]